MSTRRNVLLLVALAISVSTFTGCFGLNTLSVSRGMDAAMKSDAVVSQQPIHKPVSLTILSDECYGCYYRKPDEGSEESSWYMTCEGIPLKREEAKQVLSEMAEKDQNSLKMGLLFADFGPQLKRSLERRLSEHFSRASVDIRTEAPGGTVPVEAGLHYKSKFFRTDTKHAQVILRAETTDGSSTVEAAGNHEAKMGNGHLVWMLPLGIGTFPLGLIIASAVLNGAEVKQMERVAAVAMDRAAEKLAAALAENYRISGNTEWTLHVALAGK